MMHLYFLLILLLILLLNTTKSAKCKTILLLIILLTYPTTTIPPAFLFHFSETQNPPSHELNMITDASIGAEHFAHPSTLPTTAPLFIQTTHAVVKTAYSSGMFLAHTFLIRYHIVPERLTFSDLRNYPGSTLLLTKFVVVTTDSVENFTVDGHPDLYLTVHDVMSVLDYGNSVEMENGTLAENETMWMLDDKKEPEISFGWFLGSGFMDLYSSRPEFWPCLGVVLMMAYITYRM